MSFLIDKDWINAPVGSFLLIPSGVIHDFQNRSKAYATALNISVPGNFENHMPDIVDWFKVHPPSILTDLSTLKKKSLRKN